MDKEDKTEVVIGEPMSVSEFVEMIRNADTVEESLTEYQRIIENREEK